MNISTEELFGEFFNETEAVDKTFLTFEYVVEGLLIGLIGTFGCIANFSGMFVSWRRRKIHPFNRSEYEIQSVHTNIYFSLMCMLCCYHTVFLACSVIMLSLPNFISDLSLTYTGIVTMSMIIPVAHIAMTGSGCLLRL